MSARKFIDKPRSQNFLSQSSNIFKNWRWKLIMIYHSQFYRLFLSFPLKTVYSFLLLYMFTGINRRIYVYRSKKTDGFISSRTVSGGACIRLHRAVQSVLICLGWCRPASQQLLGSHRSSSRGSGWIWSSALADWSRNRVTVVRLYHVFILSFYD